MELINECSMRFAEDKDFRLLVSHTFATCEALSENSVARLRLLTASWPCSVRIILDVASSAKGSRRYIAPIVVLCNLLIHSIARPGAPRCQPDTKVGEL